MKRVIVTLAVTLLIAGALGYGVPAIMQMSQARQEQQGTARAAEQSLALAAHHDALFADPSAPVAGDTTGKVTIVEFFDYRCPYCKAIAGPMDRLLAENKGIRLVLKEFPILGADSVLASRAALAVPKEQYWAFHQALLEHPGGFDMPALKTIAKSVGVDADAMEAGMSADAITPALQGNRDLAKAIGVNATPAFVIDDRVFVGAIPPDALKALIDKAHNS